jgi:ubiquinone/menaquinone biosynthesis C-methylase UbiE
MTAHATYLMESPAEAARLEAKTDDAVSARLLEHAGLRRGMSAADAGAGTGAVARVMSRIVGERGRVAAIDGSEARLAEGEVKANALGLSNLEFLRAELGADALPGGPYDFVWCRFVFEYLSDPDRVLEGLVRSVAVGGKLVVADLDGNAVQHYPYPPEVERDMAIVLEALRDRFDPYAGRKLFSRFRQHAQLTDVRVHVEPYHLYAGAAPDAALENWVQKLRTIRPIVMARCGAGFDYDRFEAGFLGVLRDPDTLTYSNLIVVEAVRG